MDCEFSKLSCRTRWLGNEGKEAELLGSKRHQYLPELCTKGKNGLHGLVSGCILLRCLVFEIGFLCRKYCVTQILQSSTVLAME